MLVPDQNDLVGPQHEVQRLLGRCLLRLQQYEILLKSMIAAQTLSGTPETLPLALDVRKAEIGRNTLGKLVGQLMGDYIMKEGGELPEDALDHHGESFHFSFRMQLDLPTDSYDALKHDLRELVALRNNLVHRFIELHDLWTVDGCLRAQDALDHAYGEIDRQFEQLRTFSGDIGAARKAVAELVQSPDFFEMFVNGIAPDGQVYWPMAGIVSALRQALQELATDGWVNLEADARWVAKNQPEQTPGKYGCSRWRHVIHECGQFELRRFTHNGESGSWFRERSSTAD
jgi:hypothetical protein